MARTLKQVKDNIYIAIGRDDSVADNIAEFAINYAIQIVSAIYEVGESRQLGDLTFSATEDELLIGTSARMNDIIKARNTTDGVEMGFIPIEMLDLISPTTGVPRFYSRDGDAIIIRPVPTVNTVVQLRYTIFPEWVTEDANALPLEIYEPQIISIALVISFAALEEGESVDIWTKISEICGVSYSKAMMARKVLEGKPEVKEFAMQLGGQQ